MAKSFSYDELARHFPEELLLIEPPNWHSRSLELLTQAAGQCQQIRDLSSWQSIKNKLAVRWEKWGWIKEDALQECITWETVPPTLLPRNERFLTRALAANHAALSLIPEALRHNDLRLPAVRQYRVRVTDAFLQMLQSLNYLQELYMARAGRELSQSDTPAAIATLTQGFQLARMLSSSGEWCVI